MIVTETTPLGIRHAPEVGRKKANTFNELDITTGFLPGPESDTFKSSRTHFDGLMNPVTPTNAAIRSLFTVPILAGSLLSGVETQAAEITVTSALDDNGDGCTLREALFSAGRDRIDMSGCSPGDGADTIVFDNSLAGETITLTGGQLEADSSVTINGDIDGDGIADITINARNASRVLDLSGATNNISLKNLSIENGSITGGGAVGAGVRVAGINSFTIENCTLSRNNAEVSGGGLYIGASQGSIIDSNFINNSSVDNGGALAVLNSNVVIHRSTLQRNTAKEGAGLYSNVSSIEIIQSTLHTNTATGSAGGGIYSVSDALTITNSTISGNSAQAFGGGILAMYNDGSPVDARAALRLVNSTISDNTAATDGAGMYAFRFDPDAVFSPVRIINSIIANSSGMDCGIGDPVSIETEETSIIEDGTCGTQALAIDPLLGELANNGGNTRTHLPLDGSPAIDAGSNTNCGSGSSLDDDQRGFSRADGACDIGAVEVQSVLAGSGQGGGSGGNHPAWLLCLLIVRLLRNTA